MSQVESGDGNAILSPSEEKMVYNSQGKYWKCNYHLKDDESFEQGFITVRDAVESINCAEWFFGEEYGTFKDPKDPRFGQSKKGHPEETRHIEGGFITRTDRMRFSAIQNIFRWDYLAKSSKRNLKKNIGYAFKENNRYIKSDGIDKPEPLVKMTRDLLRPQQMKIADMFAQREHPLWGRKIYWFWEPKGNWGKSILTTYMIDQMEAYEVSGKGADVLCGISAYIEKNDKCPPIIIYDIPRSTAGYVSYQSIEKLKDGKFFSGKYESGMVRYNKPHIICFANSKPDLTMMSQDRWIIECLISEEEADEYMYPIEDYESS